MHTETFSPHEINAHVHALLSDVGELKTFLNQPMPNLPLGVLGQIMGDELRGESMWLAEKAKRLNYAQQLDALSHTTGLQRKLGVLMTLCGLIEQLPATSQKAHDMTVELAHKVVADCEKIHLLIASCVSKATMVIR